jgi:hypothetical protein
MNVDTIGIWTERLGLPTIAFLCLLLLVYRLLQGFTNRVADVVVALGKAAILHLQVATDELRRLPHQIETAHGATREHITQEHVATREHVTATVRAVVRASYPGEPPGVPKAGAACCPHPSDEEGPPTLPSRRQGAR